VKNSSLFIEHRCPQCGAPAVLEETERLFSCTYCRVRSYLGVRDFFRYRLPTHVPDGAPLFFIPYWRFKGMIFSAGVEGVSHHFLDVSLPAVAQPLFPPSLGLRSQALKLKCVSPEAQGHFVRPERSLDAVLEDALRRLNLLLPKPLRHQCRVGETTSLIYAPFYAEDGLYDGVLNTRLRSRLPEGFDPFTLPGGRPRWRLRFLPCLCPDCGWDMIGDRDSLVVHCSNCDTAWKAAADGFQKIRAAHLPATKEEAVYLPFWRIRADVEGVQLNSYEDLVRTANLPRVIRKGWDALPFFFWTPAFKIRPGQYLSLSTRITVTAPPDALEPWIPKGRTFPVTLPAKAAAEGLMPCLIAFIKPQREFLERVEEVRILPKSYQLVYFPFRESPHEWIQERYGIVINKNTLRLAKTL